MCEGLGSDPGTVGGWGRRKEERGRKGKRWRGRGDR